MTVELAYPYGDHPADATVVVDYITGFRLVYDGLARLPAGADFEVDMGERGAWVAADGDIFLIATAAARFHPELTAASERAWREAREWLGDRHPDLVVNATCCRWSLMKAAHTPAGTIVGFRVRKYDLAGRRSVNGRVLPATGSYDFVPDPLVWACEVLPFPPPVPQPRTVRARCPHGVHVIDLSEAVRELTVAIRTARPRRMRSTRG